MISRNDEGGVLCVEYDDEDESDDGGAFRLELDIAAQTL